MNQVDTALYTALTGSTALMAKATGVYNSLAPSTATPPFVVFNEQAGVDAYALSRRAYRRLLYQVKCIATGPSGKAAGEAYDLVEAVLHDAALTVTGYGLLYLRRESDVKYTEVVNGIQYWHVGAIYQVMITPSS